MNKSTKNHKTILLLLTVFLLLSNSVFSQNGVVINGVITDISRDPLIGVNIKVENSNTGTISDINGKFTILVPSSTSIISVSYIGYRTQNFSIGNKRDFQIILEEDTKLISEVVVVGYGTQKKETMTGAITTIKSDEIMKSPVGNVTQALAGRTPGLQIKQTSGQPGNDNASIRIRGIGSLTEANSAPLILVDGIERSFNQLDPEEIETVTVLKDASSTAVYGIRGANGVIIVTTKRGKEGKAQITYTGNMAVQTPTRLPKPLSSYDFARLFNEARFNDTPPGSAAPVDIYQPFELERFRDGTDPLMYPNMNWLDYAMEDFAIQEKHNVNIGGGTSFSRYYVTLGYFSQDGLQKEFNKEFGYSNKDSYRRFNLRSNIDLDLTNYTTLKLTIGGRSGTKYRTGSSFFRDVLRAASVATPGYVNGTLVSIADRPTSGNPLQQLSSGINSYSENHLDVNLELEQKLDFVTKGLKARFKAAYDSDYSQNVFRSKSVPTFQLSRPDSLITTPIVFRKNSDFAELGNPSMSYSGQNQQIYTEAALSYNRDFGKHAVTALALYTQSKKWFHSLSYPEIALGLQEFVGRATYNYDTKYLFEFNMGYNGSENFPIQSRFGFFPALSGGWVLTNEKFIQNLIGTNVLSYLKLRASYGEVGNDRLGNNRFMYLQGIYSRTQNSVQFGEDRVFYEGYTEDTFGNPNVTWEKDRKQNYAIEAKFFKDKLSINGDYFTNSRTNILWPLSTIPAHAAIPAGSYNIGETLNRGFEIETGWADRIGKLRYWINANYSFARNKIVYMDEAKDINNPHLWRTGRRVGERFGYVFEGFFNSQEEIDQWPDQFGATLAPGDVKYADVNGDGKVNTDDRVPLLNPGFPEVNYGLTAGLKYKDFDFSFLFQGATNMTVVIGDNFKTPFGEKGSAFENALGRWTPTNMENATFPRLTTNYSIKNNYELSELWIKDASYLRLKNMQIGYLLKMPQLKAVGISSIRFTLSAQNIFTWDNIKIIDPEGTADNGLNYPQLQIYNMGISVKF
jgi:TonB-linked SusC/RagA family outer membrane protein